MLQSLLILLGILAVVAIVSFILSKVSLDKSRTFCESCGSSMNGCEYEYQERSTRYNEYTHKTVVNVYIRAVCPKCGHVKEFTRGFAIDEYSDNIEFQVADFCRKTFGH